MHNLVKIARCPEQVIDVLRMLRRVEQNNQRNWPEELRKLGTDAIPNPAAISYGSTYHVERLLSTLAKNTPSLFLDRAFSDTPDFGFVIVGVLVDLLMFQLHH